MVNSLTSRVRNWAGRALLREHMKLLGIENSMALAARLNRAKFGRQDRWRRSLFANDLDELLAENGPPATPVSIRDGWAIDTSKTLPHLDRLLEEADQVIAERSGARWSEHPYRGWFQDMWTPELCERCPAFLDFATSNPILATVADYIKSIPVLSTTAPSGIRLVESNQKFDPAPDMPKDSQLYHIDYYSLPNVYVIVLLEDATLEHGPWHFLPRSISQRVRERLGYWKRGVPYRLTDEQVYSVADRKDVITFDYPRGSVLFIESSGCLHYGSRHATRPRFQAMFGYTGAIRTDFYEEVMSPLTYPIKASDSLLRRLVLDKNLLPDSVGRPKRAAF